MTEYINHLSKFSPMPVQSLSPIKFLDCRTSISYDDHSLQYLNLSCSINYIKLLNTASRDMCTVSFNLIDNSVSFHTSSWDFLVISYIS